jgi:hypothetical protein
MNFKIMKIILLNDIATNFYGYEKRTYMKKANNEK